MKDIPSIIELNKDVEPFVVQGSAKRTRFFKDGYVPLQFVHLSDFHAAKELWERMVEYVDYYRDYISFALHTGDYCGDTQQIYCDAYAVCKPCSRPVFNCVGNHDTDRCPEDRTSDKATVHKLLFSDKDSWGVEFMSCEHSMAYLKDFPESNLRLIVLDCYYDIDKQTEWLKERLDEAREKGTHVITAMHEPSGEVDGIEGVTFHSIDDFKSLAKIKAKRFERVIADFINKGGVHVCNLCGHEHHDLFGYTEAGVLNIAVECATDWDGWCDGKRVRGTRTYDCFNVMAVDTVQSLIKLVRVGNNADHYLRIKRTLCYDYKNKAVIFNG